MKCKIFTNANSNIIELEKNINQFLKEYISRIKEIKQSGDYSNGLVISIFYDEK